MNAKFLPLFIATLTLFFGCGKSQPEIGGERNGQERDKTQKTLSPEWRLAKPSDTHFSFASFDQRISVKDSFELRPNEADLNPIPGLRFSHLALFHKGKQVAATKDIPAHSPFCALVTNDTSSKAYRTTVTNAAGTRMSFFADTVLTFGTSTRMGISPLPPQRRSLHYRTEELRAQGAPGTAWLGWIVCGVFSDKILLDTDRPDFEKRVVELFKLPKSEKVLEALGTHLQLQTRVRKP